MSGLIGASVPRRDAPAKVTGAARYTDDLAVPDARFWFLEQGGREAIDTDPETPLNAVRGRAGTHIVKDEQQP